MDTVSRFTRRCAHVDLSKIPPDIVEGIERKVQRRIATASLETGDRFLSVPVPRMCTEHQGDYRAITWYDETADALWICALGYHYDDQDDPRDIYQVASRLGHDGRLLPSRDDYLDLDLARIQIDRVRSIEDARTIRTSTDQKGTEVGYVFRQFVEVIRHESGLYEVRVDQKVSVGIASAIVAALFPDNVEIEWATPERFRGILMQPILVLTQ